MIQNNIPSFPTASDTIYEASPVDGIRLIYIILMTGVLLERANSIIPGVIAAFRPQQDQWADLSQVFSAKITDPYPFLWDGLGTASRTQGSSAVVWLYTYRRFNHAFHLENLPLKDIKAGTVRKG